MTSTASPQGRTSSQRGGVTEGEPRGGSRSRTPAHHSPTIAAVVDALTGDLDDFTDQLLGAIAPSRPAGSTPPDHSEVREPARRALQVALAAIRARRGLTPGDRAALGLIGSQQAERDVAADVIVTAVQAGRSLTWRRAIDALTTHSAAIHVTVTGVGELGECILRAGDEVSAALLAGHARVQARRHQAPARTRSQLLSDLYSGVFDEDRLVPAARVFGLDLYRPHGLLLLTGRPGHDDPTALCAASTELAKRLSAVEAVMTGDVVPHTVLLVRSSVGDWDGVVELARPAARTARLTTLTSPPTAGPNLIHAAYLRARALLPVVVAAIGRPHVLAVDELLVYELLRGTQTNDRENFVERTLGPILRQSEPSRSNLLSALDVLTDAAAHTETAAAMLGVHQNTIRYRLQRIHHLAGLRYDHPPDRFKMELAVLLRRLAGTPPEPR